MLSLRSPFTLAVLWSLLVFVGLSLPGESLRSFDQILSHDKFIHFGSFLGIAALWVRVYPARWKRVLAFVLLAAWITEPYQGWMPWANREADPLDAIANTLGLLTGTALSHRRYAARRGARKTAPPPHA